MKYKVGEYIKWLDFRYLIVDVNDGFYFLKEDGTFGGSYNVTWSIDLADMYARQDFSDIVRSDIDEV